MSVVAARKFVPLALTVGVLALASGCAVLDVDMTSYPQVVRAGDPVKFDIKLTNRSQCPLDTSVALLVAFIPESEFLFENLPPDTPYEVREFIKVLQRFFDKLCSGGEPEIPEFPELATTCQRGEGEILCRMTGPLASQQGNSTSMSFASIGDRLQCEVDEGTMSCLLHLPVPSEQASGSGAGNGESEYLNCFPLGHFGMDEFSSVGSSAICFVGNFPNIGGLGPRGMARGEVTLKARGVGIVRNLVFAFADDEDNLGVCRDGGNYGKACDLDDDGCYEGSCEAGICVGGGNAGQGCDPTVAECSGAECVQTECSGGTCVACDSLAVDTFLPIDCTTTVIEPEPAPVMSSWGLVVMAAALLVFGSLWLQRRGRQA